jgi:hypothetical protein
MNGEKGQALPIAMLALAIGSLVVVPFLSHAGGSLISSRVHGEVMAEQSASDAGVEHAIWSLTQGTLAKQFTKSGDQISYQLGETLNGYSTTVTVTANATAQGGTIGDIANTVIDSLQYDTASYIPSLIKISDTVCAIAYCGPNNRGYLKTVSITSDGYIGNNVIDTLNFETFNNSCYEPSIVNVSGSIYAIVYRGINNRGYLKTISITTAGNISNTAIDTLNFEPFNNSCYEPSIVNVSGSTFAIVYRWSSNRGYLKTVSITSTGNIGNTAIDTLNFETASNSCYEPFITNVSGSTFAIVYGGVSNRGYLKTVSVPANGVNPTVIATLNFETASNSCYDTSIVNISGTTFAVVYRGVSNRGYLKTVSVPANGVNPTVIDTLNFETASNSCYEPSIISVISDIFAIAYRGLSNDGFLKTVSVAANGDIGTSAIDTLEFDSSSTYEPVIVNVIGDIFAIAYRSTCNIGEIITVGITTEAAVSAKWEIVSTTGNTSITAFVNTANTTSTIVSWQIK